jgi:hypothetical protein
MEQKTLISNSQETHARSVLKTQDHPRYFRVQLRPGRRGGQKGAQSSFERHGRLFLQPKDFNVG